MKREERAPMNTIIPLHANDIQAAFNAMVRHLASMTERSMHDEMCRYRADLTPTCPTRCVVGALIPDDEYTPGLEDYGIWFLPLEMSADWRAMAHHMQSIHDQANNWGPDGFHNWEKVRECADAFSLSTAVIDEMGNKK